MNLFLFCWHLFEYRTRDSKCNTHTHVHTLTIRGYLKNPQTQVRMRASASIAKEFKYIYMFFFLVNHWIWHIDCLFPMSLALFLITSHHRCAHCVIVLWPIVGRMLQNAVERCYIVIITFDFSNNDLLYTHTHRHTHTLCTLLSLQKEFKPFWSVQDRSLATSIWH